MTLTDRKSDSKSLSKKPENATAEDGKVNTTLPATSLGRVVQSWVKITRG